MTEPDRLAPGQRLAHAAGEMLGTPFRLHGQTPGVALDCIGVVSAALAAAGVTHSAPRGYQLRNTSISKWLACVHTAGLIEASGPHFIGDIILVRPGSGQYHLLIYEGSGSYIHAHAGLGRVVRSQEPLPWEAERRWRLVEPE